MHQYDYYPVYSSILSCLKYVQSVALDYLVLPTYLTFFADYVLQHVLGVLERILKDHQIFVIWLVL